MGRALFYGRIDVAKLILSTGMVVLGVTAADVFNHGGALFNAISAEGVQWALDNCMADSSPERPFGALKLESPSGETLLQHCIKNNIANPRIAQMLMHQEG